MKSRIAIATTLALAWLNTTALPAERGGKQSQTKADDLRAALAERIENAGETCKEVALELKNIEFYDYCMVGLIGPYFQGPNCKAFVARQPGYNCDSKGAMYYEPSGPPLRAVMPDDDLEYATKKVLSKNINRLMVTCIANYGIDNKIAGACIGEANKRFGQVTAACSKADFDVDKRHDLWLRAFDLCIESKLKM
jgi:hypothetical protein